MTSHFASEKYHLLNARISEHLFQSRMPVRVYQNSSSALYDVTVGLQQFLSHRNYLGIVPNGSSLITNLLPIWLRQSVPMQTKDDSQNWPEYIESLNSETNFVIWSSENEITGEIIVSEKEADEIHERLSKKRIFSIQITHRINSAIVLPAYALIVLRKGIIHDNSCLVVMTDKMKASSLIGPYQNIDHINELTVADAVNPVPEVDLAKIEGQVKDQGYLYFRQFASIAPRLQDRIVFSFKDINGYAVQQDVGLSTANSFAPAIYPFWILDLWSKWWKECGKESLIRGLLVVEAAAFLNDSQLMAKIQASEDKIRRLSDWNVLP